MSLPKLYELQYYLWHTPIGSLPSNIAMFTSLKKLHLGSCPHYADQGLFYICAQWGFPVLVATSYPPSFESISLTSVCVTKCVLHRTHTAVSGHHVQFFCDWSLTGVLHLLLL
jgi:hypothetical protein